MIYNYINHNKKFFINRNISFSIYNTFLIYFKRNANVVENTSHVVNMAGVEDNKYAYHNYHNDDLDYDNHYSFL